MNVVEVDDARRGHSVRFGCQLEFGNETALCSREGGHHDRTDSVRHRIPCQNEDWPVTTDGAIPDKDCIGYDPSQLSIENLGELGWRLNSGSLAMKLFDNETDARMGMTVAAHYSEQCFIGRDNDREDRSRYIEGYWD